MEKVEALVDRAKHLALHEPPREASHAVDVFHPSLDNHIEKIYKSVDAYAPTTYYFLNEIQHDGVAADATGKPPVDVLASVDAFRTYMKNATSCAMAPEEGLDTSAPLSDYFISSSHNTYLTGNQLYSDAAASAYTSVSEYVTARTLFSWVAHSVRLNHTDSGLGSSQGLSICRD